MPVTTPRDMQISTKIPDKNQRRVARFTFEKSSLSLPDRATKIEDLVEGAERKKYKNNAMRIAE